MGTEGFTLWRATALVGTAAIAVLGLATPATATATPGQRVLVQLRPSASVGAATSVEADRGGVVRDVYRHVFKGFAATLSPARIAALRADPDVLNVVADPRAQVEDTETGAPWGLDRIDQPALPLNTTYSYAESGAGVTVFVVDTGVRATHVDFGGRVVGGVDFVDRDTDPSDCDGHGTHVAGTIGGATFGVAKSVTLVPVRVLDCFGSGFGSDILAGLDWVIANKPAGPAVLNFSIGFKAIIPAIDVAAQAVVDAGISFVAAAGNEAADACLTSPGRVPAVNTVGASDINDAAPNFSDYGDCIDVFAPGVDIASDWMDSDTATRLDSGTSMSTPHVVGAIARYLQANPSATPADASAFVNTTATPHIVTEAFSVNNNLLFLPPPVAPPVVVAPVVVAPVVVPPPAPPVVPPVVVVPPPAPPVIPAVNNKIHITIVFYNGPGADTKRTLNREWVRVTNTGTQPATLTGYRLRDRAGHTYTFPATRLAGKKSIYVFTGKGRSNSRVRFWSRTKTAWRNSGRESATLSDTYGRVVSSHRWRSVHVGWIRWP